jgi:hypothetical protein
MQQNAKGNWSGLSSEVLSMLRCLTCQSPLDQQVDGLVCAEAAEVSQCAE